MNPRSTSFLIALGIGVIVAWFYVWPGVQRIEVNREKVKATSENITVMEEVSSSVNESLSFFNSLDERDKELVALAVPQRSQRIRLKQLLESIVIESGANIRSVNIGNTESGSGDVSTVSISVNATGDYDDLKSLTQEVENSLRLINITQVSIETGDTEEDSETEEEEPSALSFTLSGHAYYSE